MSKIVGIIFVLVGMFVFAVAVLGLYRFHYTLNRMHAAALADGSWGNRDRDTG